MEMDMNRAFITVDMRQSIATLLDLPDEILLIILKKLNNMDVLYSLLDIDNERLDKLVREDVFTKSLNFILTTITDDVLSIADSTLDRFCINILPKIDYNIKSLILESGSMERILLAADYPNLTELKLYNVNEHIVLHHFKVESPFRRIFQEQITDLILVYNIDRNKLLVNLNTKYVYEYPLKLFENLKHLSVIGSVPYLSIDDLASTTWLSLNLNKLCVYVSDFGTCLALLNGCLKQLSTFIVNIGKVDDDLSTVYNMDNLPNMKYFSLTCWCSTYEYDTRILILLRRMIKLEELTLNIINDERSTLIDGVQINENILVHMPCLRRFTFHISTEVELHHFTHYPSNEDIQRTFTNIGYPQVCCFLTNSIDSVICQVFSLPYAFECLRYIGNTFPSIDFSSVRDLTVHDNVAFEHEFFIRIARFFPLLKKLAVINFETQSWSKKNSISNKNVLYSTVEYPHLISLCLRSSHIVYAEQFLNTRKTHLPQLTKLQIEYEKLRFITKFFTRNATRRNCARVTQLNIDKKIAHSKDFYNYFPLL